MSDQINSALQGEAGEDYPGYPGWMQVGCGCCAGIEWGGNIPRTCRICEGSGFLSKHTATHRLALYPGGPFRGIDRPPTPAALPPEEP